MVSLVQERFEAVQDRASGIFSQPMMCQVARLIGVKLKKVISYGSPNGPRTDSVQFGAWVIVGGQIKGGKPTFF